MTNSVPRRVTPAMETFRTAVTKILLEEIVTEESPRYLEMKKMAKMIEDRLETEIVKEFAQELMATVENICGRYVERRGALQYRQEAMSKFTIQRMKTLPALWKGLFEKLEITRNDVLFEQSVNQNVFDAILLERVGRMTHVHSDLAMPDATLSSDEENALRYASGYVPMKLLRKYQMRVTDIAKKFSACLSNMSIPEDDMWNTDHDYESYTQTWLRKVDRGGLFRINDSTYRFFYAVESVVRKGLFAKLVNSSDDTNDVFEDVVSNDDVKTSWAVLSTAFGSQSDISLLLSEIASLWVTIRGFAQASSWLEQFKRAKGALTKKRKGLRKTLAQNSAK